MKTIRMNEIISMDDSEKIYVSKEAIYIQILDYERNYGSNCKQELFFLTSIIADIFDFECKKMLQRKRVGMTVSQIKKNFKAYNYYPKSSFIQYLSVEDDD